MDFSLSEDQKLLQDSVERFARHHGAAQPAPSDRMVLGGMAELGWLGIAVPEEMGGLGGSAVEVMLVMEGLGRHLLAAPFLASGVVAPALLLGQAGNANRALLEAVVAGKSHVALAAFERQGRYRLDRVETRATRDDAGWRITGAKSFVPDAAEAEHLVVSAATEDGLSLFLVPIDASGLVRSDFRTIDQRPASTVVLDDVLVPAEALIGVQGDGGAHLEAAVDRAIAALCAEAVGAMEALNAMTIEHLRSRHQFGRPLGSFQVLRHRAADLYAACEDARSLLLLATLKLDAAPRERIRAVSAAKARIGQLGRFVGYQAIQLHGAMGMCDEVAVGRYAKRLMAIDHLFGDADHHRRRFATTR